MIEAVIVLPLLAAIVLAAWPEPKSFHTPMHLRVEPKLRSTL